MESCALSIGQPDNESPALVELFDTIAAGQLETSPQPLNDSSLFNMDSSSDTSLDSSAISTFACSLEGSRLAISAAPGTSFFVLRSAEPLLHSELPWDSDGTPTRVHCEVRPGDLLIAVATEPSTSKGLGLEEVATKVKQMGKAGAQRIVDELASSVEFKLGTNTTKVWRKRIMLGVERDCDGSMGVTIHLVGDATYCQLPLPRSRTLYFRCSYGV